MAFTSTITDRGMMSRARVTWGTFTNNGSSVGGDINTGLEIVEHITFTTNASAVGNAVVVDETLPKKGNAITIVTDADETGTWMAFGR